MFVALYDVTDSDVTQLDAWEGAERVRVLRTALAELPNYKNGPYADLRKWLLEELERLIREDALTGMTSNPTIFDQAISKSADYDAGIKQKIAAGKSGEQLFFELPALDRRAAEGRAVVAHLGNGASMCAVSNGRSIATTMSFTALDGLMMGTRCGAIDPGVLLYLIDRHGMNVRTLTRLLYEQSGLLGVSGISSDMRALLASADSRALEALDLFVYRINRELGSLAAALGGLDALVFTGGIGENAAPIRARVCRGASWLGLDLDEVANTNGGPHISREGSRIGL